jgi:TM2 domain-containing membrane protein YozV
VASSCRLVSKSLPNPGVAAVLSFFLPGVGQIYNGAFLRGIFWFIVTPGLWVGSGGMLGWVCHFIAAYTAYSYAKKLNK